jgi:hypothetical protein
MVDYGEQTTGTRDEHYNLISVLYHALSGADTCERYALDAETAGDERLAAFFRETQVMQSQIAERAKGLLGILEPPPEFSTGPATDTTASGSTPDMPRTPLRDTPGDVERGTISDTPVVPPGEGVPPYVDSPPSEGRPLREEPPPGEERPERRGAAPTPPTAREEPPAGEERPGKSGP